MVETVEPTSTPTVTEMVTMTETVTAIETVTVTETAVVTQTVTAQAASVGGGSGSSSADVYYKNCTEAREAGAAPIRRGEPGYASHLDRDNDGIACE